MLILKGDTVPTPLKREIRPILVPVWITAIHAFQVEVECKKRRKTERTRELDRILEMQKLALQVMDIGTLAEEIRIISSDLKANHQTEMGRRWWIQQTGKAVQTLAQIFAVQTDLLLLGGIIRRWERA